jgi:hypothetical protein
MMRARMRPILAVALALVAACSKGDPAAKHRLFARDQSRGEATSFDPSRPESALAATADEVAARLGGFEWVGAVEWSVSRPSGSPLHVTEQHRVRQSGSGEFEVRADVDPGLGPSAVQGKEIVYAGGMTYGRALPAPFRERPTDRGQDARRFREDSFGLVRSVASMIGPGLRLEPDGNAVVLGRQALRFRFTLSQEDAPRPAQPPPAGYQAGDADTAARQGFLRGGTARAAAGELAVDAETGAPLQARLAATFDGNPAPSDPAKPGARSPGDATPVTVTVTVSGQMKAFGGEVKAITAPSGALLDERKPAGPSTALEAAGLKKRGEETQAPEPADDGD